ncbi:MAG: hypothetical protein ABIO62_17305 [Paracoccaceae bacterium]
MKYLLSAIALSALAGAFVAPNLSFADTDPMTLSCADFSALNHDAAMWATKAMHMASADSAMAMDEKATETAMMGTMEMCKKDGAMLAMDAQSKSLQK